MGNPDAYLVIANGNDSEADKARITEAGKWLQSQGAKLSQYSSGGLGALSVITSPDLEALLKKAAGERP